MAQFGAAKTVEIQVNPEFSQAQETMVPYLAQRFRADRLPAATVAAIQATIPNRLRYLDELGVTMAPLR